MKQKIFFIALGGSLGALARYGLGGFLQRHFGASFPWGTAGVNLLGCFLFGFLWALSEEYLPLSGNLRFFLLTGFMGAFTTFSTFIAETGQLLGETELFLAFCNVALHVVLGTGVFFFGLFLGRGM